MRRRSTRLAGLGWKPNVRATSQPPIAQTTITMPRIQNVWLQVMPTLFCAHARAAFGFIALKASKSHPRALTRCQVERECARVQPMTPDK
jgi:hypothetical protein